MKYQLVLLASLLNATSATLRGTLPPKKLLLQHRSLQTCDKNSGFLQECTTTRGCKQKYGESVATDCDNSGGGYCVCGDAVCGCLNASPTAPQATPTNSPTAASTMTKVITLAPVGGAAESPSLTPTMHSPAVSPPATAPTPAGGVPVAAQQAFSDPTVQALISTNDGSSGQGKAVLKILPNVDDIQQSNYGGGSFQLQNNGDKRIAAVFIDVSMSIFSDVVFDSDGSGGDSVAKKLNYDGNEGAVGAVDIDSYDWLWLPARSVSFSATAPFNPSNLNDEDNLFVDQTSDNALSSPKAGGGFRGELLLFGDFGSGESVGFSGDMDPNSIAGLKKPTVDNNANWDVG